MDKLAWCCKQKRGFVLIKPNEAVGKEYFKEAESDLKDLSNISLKWKNIVGYYACYNALYAVLQKIGIKCEIHDCSLNVMEIIQEYEQESKALIKRLKENRIEVQYYLREPRPIDEKEIAKFIIESKHIFNMITYDEIKEIRAVIEACQAKKH